MRELKFRAWDTVLNRMFVPDEMTIHIQPDGQWWVSTNDGIFTPAKFMQFTGLLDKNGVEIYEGDRVRYIRYNWECIGHKENHTDLTQNCEIYWDNKRCMFRQRGKFISGGGWSGSLEFDDSRADRCELEVIGNIYENPETLEKANVLPR